MKLLNPFTAKPRVFPTALYTTQVTKMGFDQKIDRLVTSPWTGLPIMLLLLAGVFWVTIVGANVPSQWIATALFWIEDKASALFTQVGIPWWITGFLWHGVYRGLAWVIAVMLPPMAIFFPIFTILEDLGYLPRVAFNLDRPLNEPVLMESRHSQWQWGLDVTQQVLFLPCNRLPARTFDRHS